MLAAACVVGRGRSNPLKPSQAVVLLAGTAILALLIMAPSLSAMRPFGSALGPADWPDYPEAAEGGRLTGGDRVRRQSLSEAGTAARGWLEAGVISWDTPWHAGVRAFGARHSGVVFGVLASIAVVGFVRLVRCREPAAAGFLLVPAAAAATYAAAWLAMPLLYVPERYLKFALPIAAVVMIPVGAYWLVAGRETGRLRRNVASAAAITVSVLTVLLVGSRGPTQSGLPVVITAPQMALYDFLATLPADALVAGWPESMDNVPYVTGRRVLLSRELHLPFHAAYVRELRARMQALMDAYFATDIEPVIRLRDGYGVTHLVIERAHLTDSAPTYFMPFGPGIAARFLQARARAVVWRLPDAVLAFTSPDFVVLDLTRIPPG
jgi:hypothetical protein